MKTQELIKTNWNRLKDLVRRGIIRIFPLPFTLQEAVIVIVIVIVAGSLLGCGSTRHVSQIVRNVHTDTIYLNSQQYDSIYIYKDVYRDRSRDTIYLKDVSIEYRYKFLRDTVKVIQHDSIPYEVTIVETKEITRPLTIYDKLCRSCFWFLLGFILYWLYLKVKSINHKP